MIEWVAFLLLARVPVAPVAGADAMETPPVAPPSGERRVRLLGGLPWGFRIQGGSDTGLALRIARVSPKQPFLFCLFPFAFPVAEVNLESVWGVTPGSTQPSARC